MAAQLYSTESGRLFHAGAIAIINVGLPARGKTHGSRSLVRYMTWLGVKSRHFGVGEYRRRIYGPVVSADYFDPENRTTEELRHKANEQCFQDLICFLTEQGGQVGIYDASNLVAAERRRLYDRLCKIGIRPMFIEYICDKQEVVEDNIRKVKVTSPDYVEWGKDKAFEDFKSRINKMAPLYETIEDIDIPFIKLYNVGERIIVNQINGYLQTRIVFYLMNLHISNRTIYLARSGESEQELVYKADAGMSAAGHRYAEALKAAVYKCTRERQGGQAEKPCDFTNISDGNAEAKDSKEFVDMPTLKVWTSAQVKGAQTAEYFAQDPNVTIRKRMLLRGLNPGACGSTDIIEEKYPNEWKQYIKNPYYHRFPRGESYHDVAVRLEAVILELEREKDDVLIIASESVLRCLYAYFAPEPLDRDQIPFLSFPRSSFIEIIPTAYGCQSRAINVDFSE